MESQVKIVVRDSGEGIPDDVVLKMMDPFFTTKEIGKGTGLGLGICKSIVEKHGGRLFYNKFARNTEFVIEIPIRQVAIMKKQA